MSAVHPKAEVKLCISGDLNSRTGASNHALRLTDYEWTVIKPFPTEQTARRAACE